MAVALVLVLAQRTAAEPQPLLHFVSVSINGIEQPGFVLALDLGDELMVERPVFTRLGLVAPKGEAERFEGREFHALESVPGLRAQLDRQRLALVIDCTADCFPAHVLGGERAFAPPDTPPLGAYVNYDVLAERNSFDQYIDMLGDIGIFSEEGLGKFAFSGSDMTGERTLTRLETSWTIDRPEARESLRFGDSITDPGGWGLASRFAGVKFATDFSLQPGFVAFPTPTLGGEAALPSTVDIYVNDVLRQRLQAPPGPFTIENPPVITGAGELRAVVRDLLGRETILIQPFYASPSLLREGVEDYSVEAGVLRQDFGVLSNSYDEGFLSGSYRIGESDSLTIGAHGEVSTDRAGLGPRVDWLMPFGGVLSGAVAASRHDDASGGLAQFAVNWSSSLVGFQLSNRFTTDRFSSLGASETVREPWLTSSANLSFNLDDLGSLSLNHTRVDERDRNDFEIVSANYGLNVAGLGAIGANAYRTFGINGVTGFYLSLTVPLDARTTAGATLDNSDGLWTRTARLNRSVPSDGGLGLRAEVSRGEIERERLGSTYNSTFGIADLDLSRTEGGNAGRLGLRGAAILMGGEPYLANPVTDSFALVDVGGFANVTVMRDNRPVAVTDASGRALITGLRAYEENRLSIDPLDLPLTAEIDATDICVVPCRGSGAIARFPVRSVVAATTTIVDETGTPLPPGTVLHGDGAGEAIPIGFGGAAYITGLQEPRILLAEVASGPCTVAVPAVEPLPIPVRLPPLTCYLLAP